MDCIFNKEDLVLCDYQYTVRHISADAFTVNESVFLKSNPEVKMTVKSINERTITTEWYDNYGIAQTMEIYPQCILQYRYAGLVTYRGKFNFSLN